MSHKFGFPAMTNKVVKGNKSLTPTSKSSNSLIVRVIDIIMDENHPLIKDGTYGLDSLGLVIGTGTMPNTFGKTYRALPSNPNTKKYPTVNEHVTLIESTTPNSNNIQWFYQESLGLFGSSTPNGNPFPSVLKTSTPPSQNLNYTQVGLGATNIVDNDSQDIQVNSPSNPSQATFKEESNIHPLMPFEGDVIHEGRYGNSIRFGSTSKSKSAYANNWSSTGNNGNPILILRNGQSPNSPQEGWIPVTEDINLDLSSIYLTSYQKIPFKNTLLSEYSNPQIALNSDRVVINSKSEHIIANSSKDIYFVASNKINLESQQVYINSPDVRLGADDATEPVLKGDTTNELLKSLTNAIQTLANLLQYDKNWPGGVLTPSINPTVTTVLSQLSSISTQLENGSLKSQTTKVK
jgi:hypothetical protein